MTLYNAIKLFIYMLEMIIILLISPIFGLGHIGYMALKRRTIFIKSICDRIQRKMEAE